MDKDVVDSYDCVGRDNTGWGTKMLLHEVRVIKWTRCGQRELISICFDVKLHIASAIIGYGPSREQNGPNETLIPGLPRE